MKDRVTGILLAAAMALSMSALAQDRLDQSRYGNSFQDRDRDRGGYWDRNRLAREYRGFFYDRLQSDLSRAERSRYLGGRDLERFDRAHREVGQFSAKWSRGIFDRRDMDSAIASVQRVVDIPAIRPDDRNALRDDLARMRDFRARMRDRY